MTFTKILQKMLKKDSTLEIMMQIDHCLWKKIFGLMKDELGGQIIKKFVVLCPKTYCYLKDSSDEGKGTKSCVTKRELRFKDYKKCLKASQVLNIINYLERKKIDVDYLIKDKKELLENRIIFTTQHRFKCERHIVFTEQISKIALSSNDDKRIQSVDLVQTYPHRTRKDLICKKEKVKPISIIKQYKK